MYYMNTLKVKALKKLKKIVLSVAQLAYEAK